MKLEIRNGSISLRSIYKLFFVGWVVAWGSFASLIMLLLIFVTLLTGQMAVNGEIVEGRGAALLAMSPFVLLFPIVIAFHALFFSAFLTFGVWLYRTRRPIEVSSEANAFE